MSDFRDHTCGECAWYMEGMYCRRVAWGILDQTMMHGDHTPPGWIGTVAPTTPACPEFVPSAKPTVPERDEQAPCPKCGKRSGVRWAVHLVSAGQVNAAECFAQCGHRSRAFSKTEDALEDFYKPLPKEPNHE